MSAWHGSGTGSGTRSEANPPRLRSVRAFVALGSNLEDPLRQVRSGFEALATIAQTSVAARSSLYRSLPLGPANQPDYINAAAALDTKLAPEALLVALQEIERAHGRVRDGERWGPRTLDLDLLLFGDLVRAEPELVLPHPGLTERAFVLLPLYEIAPEQPVPGRGLIRDLLKGVSTQGVRRVARV